MTMTPFVRTVAGCGDEAAVTLSGEIDWSNAAEALADPTGAAGQRSARTLVLDLCGVTYFDSAALGALFRLHAGVTAAGCSLRVVVAADSPLPALFEISQIGRLMPVSLV